MVFWECVMPPSRAEVVLRAERRGTQAKWLAQASKLQDGRFEITFNTDKCFTAPLSMSAADETNDADRGTSRFAKRCEGAEKANFEVTLAHELGHVLGIGHPGQNGFFLSPAGYEVPGLNQHIAISKDDVCSGLEVRQQKFDCSSIRNDETKCQ